MRIEILDSLLEQLKSRKLSKETVSKIITELDSIAKLSEHENSVQAYLHSHNGKKIQNADHIWKFRLTDGDRILYTYSKHLPEIYDRKGDALVLLRYAKHDDQILTAQNRSFHTEAASTNIRQINVAAAADQDAGFVSEIDNEDARIIEEVMSSEFRHTIYAFNDSDLAELSEQDLDRNPLLSETQAYIVAEFGVEPTPTLILGGAGSGKTLMAVHILHDFSEDAASENRSIYFTQSRELRLAVKAWYRQISGSEKSVPAFREINDFCTEALKANRIPVQKILSYSAFSEYFFQNCVSKADKSELEKNGIDRLAVWTEIRGVIKGQLDHDWQPYAPNSTDMGKDAYIRLPAECSTLGLRQRELVWNIYEQYRSFLKQYHYLDDNDLARETLRLLTEKPGSVKKYDLIVVDEVQDYTEVQICLLSRLADRPDRIVFAGDANQNVNPSLFQEEKLQRLFFDGKKTRLKTVSLTGNYRCPKQTVDVANALSALRRETVARGKDEREQDETSLRDGTEPYRLVYSEENMKSLAAEMMKFPGTAFLVPDEMTKNEVIKRFIGKEEYERAGTPFVHTVAEVKGMEYTYVVCCNLFGKHIDKWNEILSPEHRKKQTGERFYFNLPYAAMTRTRQHLCFADEQLHDSLEERLGLRLIRKFDADRLHFRTLSSESAGWEQDARNYEKNGKYREAIAYYKKAEAGFRDIRRCEAKLHFEEGDFPAAIRLALVAGDEDTVRECADRLSESSPEYALMQALSGQADGTQKVSRLIETIFAEGFSEQEKAAVCLSCAKHMDARLNRTLDEIDSLLAAWDER